jgi:molybdate-binding protein
MCSKDGMRRHVGAVERDSGPGARILFEERLRALQDAEGVSEGALATFRRKIAAFE